MSLNIRRKTVHHVGNPTLTSIHGLPLFAKSKLITIKQRHCYSKQSKADASNWVTPIHTR